MGEADRDEKAPQAQAPKTAAAATRTTARRLLGWVATVLLAAGAATAITLALDDDDPTCSVAPADHSSTRPPLCPPLGDQEAAWHVSPTTDESRPDNAAANRRTPAAGQLRRFRRANESLPPNYAERVTGAYTGTTDDIIEWAAWKWGIDEDLFRAQALQESDWRMSERGDGGVSVGLLQIKRTVHAGTHPLSARSTAFNVDYAGALFRYYYDGRATWLGDVEHGQPYEAGDAWGALGAHFAGRWHTAPAEDYIADVRRILDERSWPGAGG